MGARCWTPSGRCRGRGAAAVDDHRRGRPPDPRGPRAVGRQGRRLPDPRRSARSSPGSTLELGALRLDVAFFRWHIEGRTGDRPLRRHPPRVIKAVVSDFGGVVTLPLNEAFARAHAELGIPRRRAAARRWRSRRASATASRRCATLERGQMTEPDFIAVLAGGLSEVLGRPVDLDGYGERLMGDAAAQRAAAGLLPRACATRGVRLAILHQQRARVARRVAPTIPAIDELFELIVDSGFEGTRKPEPRDLRARRSSASGCAAEACAFVDDLEVNVDRRAASARHARRSHFRDTAQAIAETRTRSLSSRRPGGPRRRAPGTRPGAPSPVRATATAARSPAPAPRPRRR